MDAPGERRVRIWEFVFPVCGAALLFGAGVGPEDVVSNVGRWVQWICRLDDTPIWLSPLYVDSIVWGVAVAIIFLWFVWLFVYHLIKARSGVVIVSMIAAGIGVSYVAARDILYVVANHDKIFVGRLIKNIEVSPTSFPLHSGTQANKTSVSVTNNNEIPLYSVMLKIWTETPGVSQIDMLYSAEGMEDDNGAPLVTLTNEIATIQIASDVVMTDWKDSEGHAGALIRFYRLQPHVTRQLLISGYKPIKSDGQIRVLKAKLAPDNILTTTSTFQMDFQAPEKGSTKRQLYYKRRVVKLKEGVPEPLGVMKWDKGEK